MSVFGTTGMSFASSATTVAPVQSLDINEVWRVIWFGKWIICLCASFTALLLGYYSFVIAEPKYLATSQLALKFRNQQIVDLDSVVSGVSTDQAAINTELKIIKSNDLIEKLVHRLGLQKDPEFNSKLRKEPRFSREQIERKFKEALGLTTTYDPQTKPKNELLDTINSVRTAVRARDERNTYIINIDAVTNDPEKSLMMSNELAEIYLQGQIESKFTAMDFAVDWLSDKVADLEQELEEKQSLIKDLRSNSDLISTDALDALTIRSKDLRHRIAETQTHTMRLEDRLGELQTISQATRVADIELPFEHATLSRFPNQWIDGDSQGETRFWSQVAEMRARISNDLTRVQAQHVALETAFSLVQVQIESQNADFLTLDQLTREADATKVLYQTFLARLKEMSVQIGLQQADSRILSKALTATLVSPQKSRLIGLGYS